MKFMKWGASFLRLALAKARLRKSFKVDLGKKPAYLGRGVRLMAKPGGVIHLGRGAYIDDYSRLQASENAALHVGEYVYMNTNCRVVAAENVEIGAHTMLGPNVCVYDHDHEFDGQGVHGEVKASPVRIGERCWVAANSLVTRGVDIADKILIGGGVRSHGLPRGARRLRRRSGAARTAYRGGWCARC